jgi:hypothetical protein
MPPAAQDVEPDRNLTPRCPQLRDNQVKIDGGRGDAGAFCVLKELIPRAEARMVEIPMHGSEEARPEELRRPDYVEGFRERAEQLASLSQFARLPG